VQEILKESAINMSKKEKLCCKRAYGVVTKGNGDAFINEKTHTALSVGGGEPGQGYPCCLVCLEGNGSRPSHKGDGYSESETMYTLNSTEQHAIAYRKTGHPQNKDMPQGWEETERSDTLNVYDQGEMRTPTVVVENHSQDSRYKIMGDICQTVSAKFGTGGNNQPLVLNPSDSQGNQVADARGVYPTLRGCGGAGYQQGYLLTEKKVFDASRRHDYQPFGDKCETVQAKYGEGGNNQPLVLESNQNHATISNNGVSTTLPASMGEGGGYIPMVTEEQDMIVRRLTPLECERLQGFPDGWTDIGEWTDSKGKKHKPADSPRYKALGNSIATPFWFYVLRRISAQYERPATLGSLFDGIGGFPLCWARCNGSGSILWSSEIEEFPIAVIKRHFGDEETGEPGDIQRYL